MAIEAVVTNGIPPSSAPAKSVVDSGMCSANIAPRETRISGCVEKKIFIDIPRTFSSAS